MEPKKRESIKNFILNELPAVDQDDLDVMDPKELQAIYDQLLEAKANAKKKRDDAHKQSAVTNQDAGIDDGKKDQEISSVKKKWKPTATIKVEHKRDERIKITKNPYLSDMGEIR